MEVHNFLPKAEPANATDPDRPAWATTDTGSTDTTAAPTVDTDRPAWATTDVKAPAASVGDGDRPAWATTDRPVATGWVNDKSYDSLTRGAFEAGQKNAQCRPDDPSCGYFASGYLRKTGVAIPSLGGAKAIVDAVKKGGGYEVSRDKAQAGDLVYYYGPNRGVLKDEKGYGYHVGVLNADGTVSDSSGGAFRPTRKLGSDAHFVRPIRNTGEVPNMYYGMQDQYKGPDVPNTPVGNLPHLDLFANDPNSMQYQQAHTPYGGKGETSIDVVNAGLKAGQSIMNSSEIQSEVAKRKVAAEELRLSNLRQEKIDLQTSIQKAEMAGSKDTGIIKSWRKRLFDIDAVLNPPKKEHSYNDEDTDPTRPKPNESSNDRHSRLVAEYNQKAGDINESQSAITHGQAQLNSGVNRANRLIDLLNQGREDVRPELLDLITRINQIKDAVGNHIEEHNKLVARANVVGKALTEYGQATKPVQQADPPQWEKFKSFWSDLGSSISNTLSLMGGGGQFMSEADLKKGDEAAARVAHGVNDSIESWLRANSNAVSSSLGMGDIDPSVYKDPNVKLSQEIGKLGVYATPYVGQVIGAAGLHDLANKASSDPVGTGKMLYDQFIPQSTIVDSDTGKVRPATWQDNALRAINLTAVIAAGLHGAKSLNEARIAGGISSATGISVENAEGLVARAKQSFYDQSIQESTRKYMVEKLTNNPNVDFTPEQIAAKVDDLIQSNSPLYQKARTKVESMPGVKAKANIESYWQSVKGTGIKDYAKNAFDAYRSTLDSMKGDSMIAKDAYRGTLVDQGEPGARSADLVDNGVIPALEQTNLGTRAKAEPPITQPPAEFKTGEATWANNGTDLPVKVTGYLGSQGGEHYVSVAGSDTGVPLSQIQYKKGEGNLPYSMPVPKTLYHGSTTPLSDFSPQPLHFTAEDPSHAQIYAEAGGLASKATDSLLVNLETGDTYRMKRGNHADFEYVGERDQDTGEINTTGKKLPNISWEKARELSDPIHGSGEWTGVASEAHLHEVVPTKGSILNLTEGGGGRWDAHPNNDAIKEVIGRLNSNGDRLAKDIIDEAKNGHFSWQNTTMISGKLVGTPGYVRQSKAWKILADQLKAKGYSGIRFSDDTGPTVALFDAPSIKSRKDLRANIKSPQQGLTTSKDIKRENKTSEQIPVEAKAKPAKKTPVQKVKEPVANVEAPEESPIAEIRKDHHVPENPVKLPEEWADEKVNKTTGLRPSQVEYLGSRLLEGAKNLPEKGSTPKDSFYVPSNFGQAVNLLEENDFYGLKKESVQKKINLRQELTDKYNGEYDSLSGKERSSLWAEIKNAERQVVEWAGISTRAFHESNQPTGLKIKVPGDGEWTVYNQEQAERLRQAIGHKSEAELSEIPHPTKYFGGGKTAYKRYIVGEHEGQPFVTDGNIAYIGDNAVKASVESTKDFSKAKEGQVENLMLRVPPMDFDHELTPDRLMGETEGVGNLKARSLLLKTRDGKEIQIDPKFADLAYKKGLHLMGSDFKGYVGGYDDKGNIRMVIAPNGIRKGNAEKGESESPIKYPDSKPYKKPKPTKEKLATDSEEPKSEEPKPKETTKPEPVAAVKAPRPDKSDAAKPGEDDEGGADFEYDDDEFIEAPAGSEKPLGKVVRGTNMNSEIIRNMLGSEPLSRAKKTKIKNWLKQANANGYLEYGWATALADQIIANPGQRVLTHVEQIAMNYHIAKLTSQYQKAIKEGKSEKVTEPIMVKLEDLTQANYIVGNPLGKSMRARQVGFGLANMKPVYTIARANIRREKLGEPPLTPEQETELKRVLKERETELAEIHKELEKLRSQQADKIINVAAARKVVETAPKKRERSQAAKTALDEFRKAFKESLGQTNAMFGPGVDPTVIGKFGKFLLIEAKDRGLKSVKEVYEAVKGEFPDLDENEVAEAIATQGKKLPTRERLKSDLAQLKKEAKEIAGIDDRVAKAKSETKKLEAQQKKLDDLKNQLATGQYKEKTPKATKPKSDLEKEIAAAQREVDKRRDAPKKEADLIEKARKLNELIDAGDYGTEPEKKGPRTEAQKNLSEVQRKRERLRKAVARVKSKQEQLDSGQFIEHEPKELRELDKQEYRLKLKEKMLDEKVKEAMMVGIEKRPIQKLNEWMTNRRLMNPINRLDDLRNNGIMLLDRAVHFPLVNLMGKLTSRYLGIEPIQVGKYDRDRIDRIRNRSKETRKAESKQILAGHHLGHLDRADIPLSSNAPKPWQKLGGKTAGLADAPFYAIYYHTAEDIAANDMATRELGEGATKADIDTLRDAIIRDIDNYPEIQIAAHDFALNQTFNNRNLLSKAHTGLRQALKNQFEADHPHVYDSLDLLTNQLGFVFAKVLGNVYYDANTRSPLGLVIPAVKLRSLKKQLREGSIEEIPLDVRLSIDQMFARGLIGTALLTLGYFLSDRLYNLWQKGGVGKIKRAQSGPYVDWGDFGKVQGPMSVVLLALTNAIAKHDRSLDADERGKLMTNTITNMLFSNPLTSNTGSIVDVVKGDTDLSTFAARKVVTYVPGVSEGRDIAGRMDTANTKGSGHFDFRHWIDTGDQIERNRKPQDIVTKVSKTGKQTAILKNAVGFDDFLRQLSQEWRYQTPVLRESLPQKYEAGERPKKLKL